MIQVYADDALVYDSRLEEYDILGLKVVPCLNKGGSAEIVLPPGHPAYNSFLGYRTIVTIYRDGWLLFRGRALYPTDDYYNRRKITCEGERCLLRDGVMRPYIYQTAPADIFADVINQYNGQVDAWKQFQVGTVTVTDANDYLLFTHESAEPILDTIDRLVERCGGYIVFTSSGGARVINWYADLTYRSSQTIEFGENLIDFKRFEDNADLATVIVPYGAKLEDDSRVTIEEVNDGRDYIQDDDAVALRGRIVKPVFWDDVTLPTNLLTKARKYLASSKMILTSLELTAVDLSLVDKSVDQFQVGDNIHVISTPHGVDDWFQLTEMNLDLLQPSNDKIVLGKTYSSLSGASVTSERDNRNVAEQTVKSILVGYDSGVAAAVEEATISLTALIKQTSETIQMLVAETYTTGDEVTGLIASQVTQLAESITFQFTRLQAIVDSNDDEARKQFQTIEKYIRFDGGDIVLGEVGNEITLRIENDKISFLDGGAEVAYLSDKKLYVTNGEYLTSLKIGKYAFIPRQNGNLSFKVVT